MLFYLGMVWNAEISQKQQITNIFGKGWAILLIVCNLFFCYFGLALSGIASQPIRLSDVLNLKSSKTIWGIKLIFCLNWSQNKYHAILRYGPKILLANQFAAIFIFDNIRVLYCDNVLVKLVFHYLY